MRVICMTVTCDPIDTHVHSVMRIDIPTAKTIVYRVKWLLSFKMTRTHMHAGIKIVKHLASFINGLKIELNKLMNSSNMQLNRITHIDYIC